ncbi:class I SAM-dependent methyltransferase [Simplicispira suum]|uniref:class I SAM-dependent methyltransferase n=1 Tax=Simplicispira suum TaxID=2109915 RepID=UPI001FE4F879|nr:methyltransferase domain-containing protein [Simplicispira suum]
MTAQIIGLHQWFDSPPGRYLLEWEQARYDEAVVDAFGYHGLQLGMPLLDGLQANRMPHRWRAVAYPELLGVGAAPELLADPVALPFPESSIDLLLLPHTLELSEDPHAALREAARVLVPEGRLVISGLNPVSLWALRQGRARMCQRFGHGRLFLPDVGEVIGHWRLRDWLRLLGLELESLEFGCYRPAVRSEGWLNRFAWMDPVGTRCWPIFGAAYFAVAVKRVAGMRLLEPAWRTGAQRARTQVPVANRSAAPFQSTGKTE